jgi:zinc transporter ZupT
MNFFYESIPLLASIAAVFAGPWLFSLSARFEHLAHGARWVAVTAIVLIVSALVLPECLREAGWLAAGSLALGVAFPMVAERALPDSSRGYSLWLLLLPLVVHALLDGVALRVGSEHAEVAHHAGHGLILALVLHRLPEGIAIWCLARQRGRHAAIGALCVDALCTSACFYLVHLPSHASSPATLALLEAFVGGILLHILFHQHSPRPGAANPGATTSS